MAKASKTVKDKYTTRSDLPPREFDSDLKSPALSNQKGDAPIARGSKLPNEEAKRKAPAKRAAVKKKVPVKKAATTKTVAKKPTVKKPAKATVKKPTANKPAKPRKAR